MKRYGRTLSLAVVLSVIIGTVPAIALPSAEGLPAADRSVSLDLKDGEITITKTGYTQGGSTAEFDGSYQIRYTGGGSNRLVFRNGADAAVILDNVHIRNTLPTVQSGILIDEGSDVRLILRGENSVLFPDSSRIGTAIAVGATSSLAISAESGTDKLTVKGGAYGAGIGSVVDAPQSTARIRIDSGTIMAETGNEGAAIGGARKSSAEVVINGGTVRAASARNGAAIGAGRNGAGGSVAINGGNVIADASAAINSAGIGGGFESYLDAITITGGVVTALSGTPALAGIANGIGVDAALHPLRLYVSGGSVKTVTKGKDGNTPVSPVLSASDTLPVSPVRISLPSAADPATLTANGISCRLSGTHPDDEAYYLYLPAGDTALSCSGSGEGYAALHQNGQSVGAEDWRTPSSVSVTVKITENVTVTSGTAVVSDNAVLTAPYRGTIVLTLSQKPSEITLNGRVLQPESADGAWTLRLETILSDGELRIGGQADGAIPSFRFSASFADGMLLQRDQPVRVTGYGPSGASLSVSLGQNGQDPLIRQTASVGSDGRWAVTLPGQPGSFDSYTITAVCGEMTRQISNVVFGELWVAGGQSNMAWNVSQSAEGAEWEGKPRNPHIRMFLQTTQGIDTPLEEPNGYWATGENWADVRLCSAIAYYFAESLSAALDVPVGIINTARGGSSITEWIGEDTLQAHPDYDEMIRDFRYPLISTGYNARIAPFSGFQIAGILWYQGEADCTRPDVLRQGLPILYEDWCRVFNPDGTTPAFLSMQLAAYGDLDRLSAANAAMAEAVAEMREGGSPTLEIPLYDVEVDVTDIHPRHKQPVADRVFSAVLGLRYALTEDYGPPVLTGTRFDPAGRRLTLTFDQTGSGLRLLKTDTLSGFSISGSPVSARITGDDTVILDLSSIPNLPASLDLSYAWADGMLTANLAGGNGFPVMPFQMTVGTEGDESDISGGSVSPNSTASRPGGSQPSDPNAPQTGVSLSGRLLILCLTALAIVAAGLLYGFMRRFSFRRRVKENKN